MKNYVVHERYRMSYECNRCGAIVIDMIKHDNWHSRILTMFGGPPPLPVPPTTERVPGAAAE